MTDAKRETGRSRTRKTEPAEPAQRLISPAIGKLLDELGIDSEAPAHDQALGALALNLAGQLDSGAGMASAAIGRELRATLDQLRGDDDGDPDDAFAKWEADLAHPS